MLALHHVTEVRISFMLSPIDARATRKLSALLPISIELDVAFTGCLITPQSIVGMRIRIISLLEHIGHIDASLTLGWKIEIDD